MDPLTIGTLAAQGAVGLAQSITGLIQGGKAKKMALNNKRPVYTRPKEINENQAIAESRASKGLSDQSIDLFHKGSDRAATTAIDAVLKGGGSVNNIAELYSKSVDGEDKLALLDDEMRSRNLRNLTVQNETSAEYADKEFQTNVWGPYADTAKAAMELKKQGSENTWKGINTMISAGANAAVASGYEKEGANVFGSGGGAPAPYNSRMIPPATNPARAIASRYPGLISRPAGISSLDPIWSEEQQSYIDPYTRQPIQ